MGNLLGPSGPPPSWQTASMETVSLTPEERQAQKKFTDNSICTGKYNMWNFVPKCLMEQFQVRLTFNEECLALFIRL
jgi:hypothetical protein